MTRELFHKFDNLLSKRILIFGLGLVLVLSIVISTYSFLYLATVQDRKVKLEVSDRIIMNIIDARRTEKNYLLFRIDNYKNSCFMLMNKIKEDGSFLKAGTGIRNNTDLYRTTFEAVVSDCELEENITEELRVMGRALIATYLAAYDDGTISLDILEKTYDIRRYEKNYMLWRTDEAKTEVLTAISAIKTATDSSTLVDSCDQYKENFDLLVSIYDSIETKVANMRIAGRTVQTSAEEASIDALKAWNTSIANAITLGLTLIVVIIMCGIMFILIVSNLINDAIKDMDKSQLSVKRGLQRLGLTKDEAKTFLTLLSLSDASASSLCKKTRIHNSKIYYILESLERLGLIFVREGTPKIYTALHPIDALENLKNLSIENYKKKMALFDKVTLLLSSNYQAAETPTTFTFKDKYVFFHQMKEMIDETLSSLKAEEALQECQEKFRIIYEESPIGIKIYNAHGNLVSANKTLLDTFGVSEVKEIKDFSLFDEPWMSYEIKMKLKGGEKVRYQIPFDFETEWKYNNRMKSGIIYLDISIIPIFLISENSLNSYIVQIQDITDRKKAETYLKRIEELEKNIGEPTSKLEKIEQHIRK